MATRSVRGRWSGITRGRVRTPVGWRVPLTARGVMAASVRGRRMNALRSAVRKWRGRRDIRRIMDAVIPAVRRRRPARPAFMRPPVMLTRKRYRPEYRFRRVVPRRGPRTYSIAGFKF